jgi:dolichol-phosphate mannosyltransferase
MSIKKPKISILIPVFNEGINIEIMLKFIKAMINTECEILIIYDFEEDDTLPIVKKIMGKHKNVKLIHNTLGKGVTNAIKSGLQNSKGEYASIITADDIGPVLSIEKMVVMMEKGCDIISCTRYSHGGRVFGGSFIGRQLSRTANKLFYLFGPKTFTDSTVGIKMLRVSKFKKMKFESKAGWSIGFELAIKSQKEKMKLGECPITSINRFYGGESSFSLNTWLIEYIKWFIRGLKDLSGPDFRRAKVLRKL